MREERAAQLPDHSHLPVAVKPRPINIATSAASMQKTVKRLARSKYRVSYSVPHIVMKV